MTVAADYWQKERISKNGSGAKRIQKVAHTEGEKKKKVSNARKFKKYRWRVRKSKIRLVCNPGMRVQVQGTEQRGPRAWREKFWAHEQGFVFTPSIREHGSDLWLN